jgi:phosphopantothenoylcysteine decarboxylase/phosphopantothenate--cysteine ligase
LELQPNPDILATLAADKGAQVVVGYAAETDDLVENARKKLESKHADLIVANLVGAGRAFGTDDNEAVLISAESEIPLERASKAQLAMRILDAALALKQA